MRTRLFSFSTRKSQRNRSRPVVSARPQVEVLEDRVVPALLNHGGPIIASIQTQALYLGSGWTAAPIPTSQFDTFLSKTVTGTKAAPTPYLGMLSKTGFTGVTGGGSASPGAVDNISVPGTILDSQLQTDLASAISSGLVQAPDANTVYVLYVQPNVVVDLGNGQNSTNAFLGYHSSFTDANGNAIRYAVIPYAGGTVGNAQAQWLPSAFDSMTAVTTHELSETITDPDGTTWYDRSGNENGDIVNGSTVYLTGYAVQREVALPGSQANFLATTPAGATAGHTATFGGVGGALVVDGKTVANPSGETGTIVSLSGVQGIDDFGQPMTAVVFSDGKAYEYHDFLPGNPTAAANPGFFPWTSLGGNVKQAVAGQAVSYVLLTNGNLGEYVDPNYTTYYYGYGVNPGARSGGTIASNVTAITAVGTDQIGVNAVEYTVRGSSAIVEWRDVTGKASTTTSGFTPATTHANVQGGPVLTTQPQDATLAAAVAAAVAAANTPAAPAGIPPGTPFVPPTTPSGSPTTPSSPTGQQTQATAQSELLLIQFALVTAQPTGVLSTFPGAPVAVVVPSTAQAAPTVAPPPLVPTARRAASGSDESDIAPPELPIETPDAPAPAPAMPPRGAEEEPLAIPGDVWEALDGMGVRLDGQPLAVADEAWAALPEQAPAAPPVLEGNVRPALGAVGVAAFVLGLVGERRTRRGQDRAGRHWSFGF